MRRLLQNLFIITYFAILPATINAHSPGQENNGITQGANAIRFIENKGQWPANILFRAEIPGGKLYLEKNALTYYFQDKAAIYNLHHNPTENALINCHVVKVNFVNALQQPTLVLENKAPEYYNYFIGNDASKWQSNVNAYGKATLKELWPGIDFELLSFDGGIKYNFIVKPGANANQIALEYNGADDLLLKEGMLHVKTSLTEIIEDKPEVFYAEENGKSINAKYRLNGNLLSFDIGKYSKSKEIIIDPIVVFATFSGSVADNFGFTATYDFEGNTYSGGTVYDHGFPTTTGAYQIGFKGGNEFQDLARDCGILKFNPDGSKLLFATYIGGSDNEQPHSMVINNAHELVILGSTLSNNFPVSNGAYDQTYNGGGDIFVFKLSNDGKQMLASTFIGGSNKDGRNDTSNLHRPAGPLAYNYGDPYRGEVIVDKDDNILIASSTQSANFPAPNGAQRNYSGQQDGCVVKLRPDLSAIIWTQFIGGSDADAAFGINIDSKGNIFVCGGTSSTKANGFPTTTGAFEQNGFGERDGYLAKLRATDGTLQALTFVGTREYDRAYFVQIDENDNTYITGQTTGNFPVSNGVYNNSGGKQFIAVFNNNLTSMVKSTVFGSGRSSVDISPSAFLVDLCGRVYVSGWGGMINRDYNSLTGLNTNLPITADAYQKITDGSDFYLIILSRNMEQIVYGSYFGGRQSHEHVDGGTSRFDRDGIVYQSVCGGCGGYSDFPTTEGAWSRVNRGRRPNTSGPPKGCNNAVFKVDLNSSEHAPVVPTTILTVVATETLEYTFEVTDADPQDSIFISYNSNIFNPSKIPSPIAEMSIGNGMKSVKGTLKWETNCSHVSTDTYFVFIYARDNGCPTPREAEGVIKIVVLPPPLPEPPKLFCLKLLDDNSLDLTWGDFEFNKYFKEYRLVKIFPDGTEQVVKSITSLTDNYYHDNDVPDHLNQDFCYVFYGVNVCDSIGDSTRRVCSIPDEDTIPQTGYIHTVTVENNKNVKIVWNQYQNLDFYKYYIYRKENKPGADFRLYRILTNRADTTYLDSNVNVQALSYCYRIVIVNQCGLESPPSNDGCSILLKGLSVPFEHHLNWNAYTDWPAGVERYEIIRWDPTKPDSMIGQTTQQANFTDDNLNYDMGLYWYKIIAYEAVGGQNAISVSNHIRLVQAPLVHVPNAFTPNRDTLNDLWNVVPVFVKDFHLKVFNRWGGFVWETSNKKELWDGTWKSRLPFDNVFIWQVEYTGWDESKHYRNGNVTILR